MDGVTVIGDPVVDFRGVGPMVTQIAIELETPGDSRTMFRLRIDARLIADDLTAAQAHVLVGEILERITRPHSSEGAPLTPDSDAAIIVTAPSLRRSRWRVFVDTLLGREDAAEDAAASEASGAHV